MRSKIVLLSLLVVGVVGCSSAPPATVDNSKELESLKSQIEELKNENTDAIADNSKELEALKSQIEELQKENGELLAQLESAMAPTVAPEATAVVASSGNDGLVAIGETSTLGDWSIVISSIEVVDSIKGGMGSYSPDAGNKFLQVNATITNNGKSAAPLLQSFSLGDAVQVKITYGDGYEFNPVNLMMAPNSLYDESINPLSSKDGFIAFELPDSVASGTDQVLLQFSAGVEKTSVKVR